MSGRVVFQSGCISTSTSGHVAYRIAGNFGGLTLSRIDENIEFREKTFAECQSGIWAGPYYTKN